MPEFSYKTLTCEHASDWQKLRVEGVRDFPLGFLVTLEEAQSADLERCREILSSQRYRGIFVDKKLIGFCGYHPQQLARVKHRAEVGPFYVDPTYHGSGAAKALMAGVIDEATIDGLAQLELFVDTENPRAFAFYKAQGFVWIATHPDSVRVDGKSQDDHFLIRRL